MKIKYCFLAVLSALCLSCHVTENIYLEPDGSGKVNYEVDASGLMDAIGGALGEQELGKSIDSTFTFRQLLEEKKDSIAQLPESEQQRLRQFQDMKVHLKMDSSQKMFRMDLLNDFKNVSEMKNMGQAFQAVQDLEKKAGQPENPLGSMMGSSNNVEMNYSYDGKTFRRALRVIDPALHQREQDTTGMLRMILAGSQYVVKYHFPKKVKSVSSPNAELSADKKVVTVPFTMAEYIQNPEITNFEVLLDKK